VFVGALLRFGDLFAVFMPGLAVYFLYVFPQQGEFNSQYLSAALAGCLVSAAQLQWFGAYRGDYLFSRRLRVGRVLAAWGCSFGVLLGLAFALKVSGDYSRVWAFAWFAGTAGLLAFGRLAFAGLIRHWAQSGRFANRTVIWGAGDQGRKLAAYLDRHGDVHTEIIGHVDDRKTRIGHGRGHEILGDTDDLIEMVRNGRVDQVLVALPWTAEARLRDIVRRLSVTPVPVRLAPEFAGFAVAGRKVARVAQIPMIEILERPISGWSYVLKAAEDRVLGAALLLFLGPLMLLIALAVKLDSPGPVLFRQKRYGFNNQIIEVFKFRTMYVAKQDQNAERLTCRDDPRVTRVGCFLRRTSLDELPQFLHVVTGEMSIVGPRPHATMAKAGGRLYRDVVEQYAVRHKVKPGITGWAQVNGWRGETDTEQKLIKRVEHDLHYIDHWSIWLDLAIIAKTVFVVFKDENAY
jgi:Undecaprenyl-phosphate glucose phosphotransferase